MRVFSGMSDSDQQLTKLNVVGGFQTDSMKAKWDEETTGNCEFCGQLGTREHRLLRCTKFLELRAEWKHACEILENKRREWIYLPIPRQHPDVVVLRAWPSMIKVLDPPPIQRIQQGHCRFFTDGGAIHPRHPFARIASWSVVQDVAGCDTERRQSFDFAFGPRPCFPAFRTIAIGLVPKDQNVPRGELYAVRTALVGLQNLDPHATAEFVTDASYVCLVIAAIESGAWKLIEHRIPNLDLITEIAHRWDNEQYKVTKVKSHINFEKAKSYH